MQHYTHGRPLEMICIAAPEDTLLLTQWETHLRPLQQANLISFWSEPHISAGVSREQAWKHHLEQADLIVLLLSSDFFASAGCQVMMEQALKHAQASTTKVIPLLLRPVAWEESPLGTLAPWPSNGKPITQWDDLDAAWEFCVQELRRLLGRRVSEVERSVKQADPDWDHMLRRLRKSYKELLDQSLHGIAWVELGLSTRPDLVSNVTNLLFRLPQGGERLLPPGTSMLSAYDEADGELLILGAPGAGKSTLLLDLARQLVGRAFVGDLPLLPVIVRLSSWAIRRPELADWLVEQLKRTYGVPQSLSERWVNEGRILPLLDGLDEMEEEARPACIKAINSYHQSRLAPLVVCSRQAEYEGAADRERLALQSAVIVQPLGDEQVEGYLCMAGSSFAGVQVALQQESALRELATTPLMLSVLLFTYQGVAASEIIQQGNGLEQQVWADYVARQVAEKGHATRYPLECTRAWLSWLAVQMRTHQQAIFYAEYLQPDWLAQGQQQTVTWLAMRLPAMVIGGCACLLVALFVEGGLITPPMLLQLGLLGGFVGSSFSRQFIAGPPRATQRLSGETWVSLRTAILLGGFLAASYGLNLYLPQPRILGTYSLGDWIRDGSILGLGSGLSYWIFQQLPCRRPSNPGRKMRVHAPVVGRLTVWFTRIAAPSVWQAATALGAGMGLSYGLRGGLRFGRRVGLSYGLGYGLSVWLSYGLNLSIMVVLVSVILAGSMRSLRFAERVHWTWRDILTTEHLRTSLIVAGTLFLFFGLSIGLSVGLSYGLSGVLSGVLAYWVLLGLYQGMKQEHLEDQDRQRFNQGIRRSLRNGLLLGLISAFTMSAIGVLSGVLSVWLSYGLHYGLSRGLHYGLSRGLRYGLRIGLRYAWIVFFAGTVIMWALSGGLTILCHYVIRWSLSRSHTFPFRAQAFLDDATTRILLRRVGGGYSFIHRRLQDYFADAAVPPSQK
jgi:NACHT domain/TIR domain